LEVKIEDVNYNTRQLWIKGESKAKTKGVEDYFTLMNSNSTKELVAISSSFLIMKGKSINYLSLPKYCFFNILPFYTQISMNLYLNLSLLYQTLAGVK
jgi:hypothetical protein